MGRDRSYTTCIKEMSPTARRRSGYPGFASKPYKSCSGGRCTRRGDIRYRSAACTEPSRPKDCKPYLRQMNRGASRARIMLPSIVSAVAATFSQVQNGSRVPIFMAYSERVCPATSNYAVSSGTASRLGPRKTYAVQRGLSHLLRFPILLMHKRVLCLRRRLHLGTLEAKLCTTTPHAVQHNAQPDAPRQRSRAFSRVPWPVSMPMLSAS